MVPIVVAMTVGWLTRTQWCWRCEGCLSESFPWGSMLGGSHALHFISILLMQPCGDHAHSTVPRSLSQDFLFMSMSHGSPQKPFAYHSPSLHIPGGLIQQRQPLRKAACAPCRNSSLSSAWTIRACCLGSHKWSLNGRRHTWQRDDCLYADFPLSSLGPRALLKLLIYWHEQSLRHSVLTILRVLLRTRKPYQLPTPFPSVLRRHRDLLNWRKTSTTHNPCATVWDMNSSLGCPEPLWKRRSGKGLE